jgi:hypothetical protein
VKVSTVFITLILMLSTRPLPLRGEEAGTAVAERISIGISANYLWWDPVWGRISQAGDMFVYALLNRAGPFYKFEKTSREYRVKPALSGAVRCDVDFIRGWGLSAEVAAGAFRDSSVMVTALTNNPVTPSEYIKYTVDTVNFGGAVLGYYRPAPWARIFLGPAYQGYVLKERNSSYLFSQSMKEETHMIGFDAGGAFIIGLYENLSLRPSLSFLWFYGITTGNSAITHRNRSLSLGGAAVVPLAYSAEKIHTTFTLGFSYRFLYYLNVSNNDYLNRWDHRFGITESITYSF